MTYSVSSGTLFTQSGRSAVYMCWGLGGVLAQFLLNDRSRWSTVVDVMVDASE